MIYLIDDTNLDSMNASYILDGYYDNVLNLIRNVEELIDSYDRLLTANCIMIHATFAGSRVYTEKLAVLTNDGRQIPFVVFSAGDSEHAIFNESDPSIIRGLKKTIFYSRLPFFLDSYKLNHIINLRLLAFGKDYEKIKVRSLALSILRLIEGKEGEITLQELAKIAACPDFKELISLSNPQLGITYEDLLEELEDNPISFSCFRNNINQIVNSYYQYGKNIYIWK